MSPATFGLSFARAAWRLRRAAARTAAWTLFCLKDLAASALETLGFLPAARVGVVEKARRDCSMVGVEVAVADGVRRGLKRLRRLKVDAMVVMVWCMKEGLCRGRAACARFGL